MQLIHESYENRTHRPIKIIQFGEGNFLRAFVDWMVYKTNEATDFDGGIAVVQPLAGGLCDMLEAQDCLYTHYMNGMIDGVPSTKHYINDSIETTVNPYEDTQAYLSLAEIDTVKIIVSNTTEAGIAFDGTDTLHSAPQKSYPGKLTALLHRRYEWSAGHADKGFIILPCELIDYNGDKLKELVHKYADLWQLDKGFKSWLETANTFCNTLVDRIVPGYPRERIDEVTAELGYKDNLVVESEVFNLWVIEGPDSIKTVFPVDRTDCNVLFVEDVTPYKTRKVRILNGAHSSMVPIGYLYGLDTVMDTVEDPMMGQLIQKALFEEIIPTLTLAQDALELFAGDVLERFKNPFIKHYLMSISLNSMSKYKTRILPSLLGYLEEEGQLPQVLTLALAAYVVFYRGDRDGASIELKDNDDILALYKTLWTTYDNSKESVEKIVEGILGYEQLWGNNMNAIPRLTSSVTDYVTDILDKGMKTVVEEVLA